MLKFSKPSFNCLNGVLRWACCLAIIASVSLPSLVPAQLAAADLCVVPVENGTPTEADVGDVHRMVSTVQVIPGLSSIYIAPLNRGGRWTIDPSGAYVPFDEAFPTRKFFVHKNWVLRSDGTVVGANRTDLFILDPQAGTFRHLLSAVDAGLRSFGKLSHDAHSDTVFIQTYSATGEHLYEFDGEGIVRSRFSLEAERRGIEPIYPPRYIAMVDAYLITTKRGYVHLRGSDGTWRFAHEQFWSDHFNRAYMRQIYELPDQRLIAVLAAQELFVIDVADPDDTDLLFAILNRGNLFGRAVYWSAETGTALVYDEDLYFGRERAVGSHWEWYLQGVYMILRRIFIGRLAAPETAHASESWLLKITREGMVPVPGHVIRPGRRGHAFLTDLPGWGMVLVFSEDGLALFDGSKVELVPDSGPERIGTYPWAVLLPTLDRVLITSERGIFELTRDRELRPLETPFQPRVQLRAGLSVSPAIFDAPTLGGAVILSGDGVFFLDRDGEFHPARGGDAVGFSAGAKVVAALPSTGDLLVMGPNALFLLRQGHCAG